MSTISNWKGFKLNLAISQGAVDECSFQNDIKSETFKVYIRREIIIQCCRKVVYCKIIVISVNEHCT